ncbi:MAG: hypothetical protein ACC657_05575 [Thiohalomonadales bacterium]
MPVVEYLVKRSIIRVAFFAANNDISITLSATSPVEYQIKSASNEFIGLNIGEWVYVTGFLNIQNNGWHQISKTSTSSTITTNSILIAETSGQDITLTGYLFGLNETVKSEFRFQSDDRDRLIKQDYAIALNGNTETITNRRQQFFNIVSSILIPSDLALMVQFLDSVESGESFQFDREGTIVNPNDPVPAFIDGAGYTEQRLENNIDKRISFRVRLA